MAHILLVEDDTGTADEIALELVRDGHRVTHRSKIAEGDAVVRGGPVNLLIVDRQLPDGEGLDLIARLRSEGRRTPALVLSALGTLDDRVRGLRAGGDDHLPKPFALVELVARVQALLRRPDEVRATRRIAGPLDYVVDSSVSKICTRRTSPGYFLCAPVIGSGGGEERASADARQQEGSDRS